MKEIHDDFHKRYIEQLKLLSKEINSNLIEYIRSDVTCNKCGSDLLSIYKEDKEIIFECASCHEKFTLDEIEEDVVPYLEENMRKSNPSAYDSVKYGDIQTVFKCPNCKHLTYYHDDYESECKFCGYSYPVTNCSICGSRLNFDELEEARDNGRCSNCNYMLNKALYED